MADDWFYYDAGAYKGRAGSFSRAPLGRLSKKNRRRLSGVYFFWSYSYFRYRSIKVQNN